MSISKVMLVDDDEDLRLLGRLALGDVGGWETLVASSGPEAVTLASTHRPDVILLDFMMPGVDGVATLELLRANADTADIPVIFMTAKAQRDDVQRYLELGAIGVIGKPFDPIGLADEIRRIMAVAHGQEGDDGPR